METTSPSQQKPKEKHQMVLVKPDCLTSALVKIRDDGRFKMLDYWRTEGGWVIKYMTRRVENQ